jgi:hypothetical protein
MKIMKNRKILIVLLVFILVSAVIAVFLIKKPYKQAVVENVSSKQPEVGTAIDVDFNGDGVSEKVNVVEVQDNLINMEVYDNNGKKIATLWDGMSLYPTTLYRVINLNTKSQKQYLQWNTATGPHQVETVFLTIIGDKIHPIYSSDFEKKVLYSPFYTSRGEIIVGDANNDGLSEVIESVDEYPVNAPRLEDPNIEEMIRDEFSKNGVDEKNIQNYIKIVTRENYGKGRGRKVIMAVHSFVDAEVPFFRKLPADEYEKIAGPLIAASIDIAKKQQEEPNDNFEASTLIRYSDLEQDSKDFNDFVRDFWTHGRPFEFPFSEDMVNYSILISPH